MPARTCTFIVPFPFAGHTDPASPDSSATIRFHAPELLGVVVFGLKRGHPGRWMSWMRSVSSSIVQLLLRTAKYAAIVMMMTMSAGHTVTKTMTQGSRDALTPFSLRRLRR
jgi:hypothetical protein